MHDICPICRKPANLTTRPFCSPRCADIDLGRWLTEQYALPGSAADPEDQGASGEGTD
jgi:endogenous inhibitor of DNA gyrase (YacG/DUF329 family)